MRISANARATPPSGIREVVHRAMKLDGVVRLEVGEGGLLTPPHVLDAAFADAAAGATRYTASAGDSELREAIAAKLRRDGVAAGDENVLVTVGGVQGIFLAFAALCDPGDSVLVPDPGWPNYEMMCRMLGLRCGAYACRPEHGFLPDPAAIEAAITPRTRLLVLNSPNNPSGAVYPPQLVEEVAALAARKGVVLISDEAYEELYYGDRPASASTLAAVDDGRIVSVFSFSKTYAMTGLRVGYVVGAPELIRTLAKLQEPTISCVSSVSQRAALAALRDDRGFAADQRRALDARRATVVRILEERAALLYRPEGAFYMLIGVGPLDSREFALALLEEDRVAVAPGTAFGALAERFVRICYAGGGDALEPAVRRLLDRKDEAVATLPAVGSGTR